MKMLNGGGGGLRKFVYLKTNRRGEGLLKIELLVREATKISNFQFQYLHSPLVILNKLSPRYSFLNFL